MGKLYNLFNPNREKIKDNVVTGLFDEISDSREVWTPAEMTEIYNRLGLRLFERSKEKRSQLITEAREYQTSMKDIRI